MRGVFRSRANANGKGIAVITHCVPQIITEALLHQTIGKPTFSGVKFFMLFDKSGWI